MATRTPIIVDEWYHCFNRGVDKRRVFVSSEDYERFLALLYICNGTHNIRLSERYSSKLLDVLADKTLDRGETLVELGAYALMPNHIHLLCKEIHKGGIAVFMQKVLTGYTMYFNKKYKRTGPLLSGVFKSRHVDEDRYFKQVVSYILLNPAELYEPGWKEGKGDIIKLKKKLLNYKYASLADFMGNDRPEGKIVSDLSDYYDNKPSLAQLIRDAHEYYESRAAETPTPKVSP
ncbi:MAG TPA: transposase [Candidatus Paceibacterota bacterium]